MLHEKSLGTCTCEHRNSSDGSSRGNTIGPEAATAAQGHKWEEVGGVGVGIGIEATARAFTQESEISFPIAFASMRDTPPVVPGPVHRHEAIEGPVLANPFNQGVSRCLIVATLNVQGAKPRFEDHGSGSPPKTRGDR